MIPAFPGTNSEYDSAKAFREAGADAEILVFRNLTARHIEESLTALAEKIRQSQILMFPGGFSAGDEPDGSAKFIATIIRSPRVADAIMDLLNNRDGLILGICNGFQALIKTGLVPYGEIREPAADSRRLSSTTTSAATFPVTRTPASSARFRHGLLTARSETSTPSRFPMAKANSSPARKSSPNSPTTARSPPNTAMLTAHRPWTSPSTRTDRSAAIEGITSPCGRVFGKMGHSERAGSKVAKNIPGNKHQPIFKAGVAYFAR